MSVLYGMPLGQLYEIIHPKDGLGVEKTVQKWMRISSKLILLVSIRVEICTYRWPILGPLTVEGQIHDHVGITVNLL